MTSVQDAAPARGADAAARAGGDASRLNPAPRRCAGGTPRPPRRALHALHALHALGELAGLGRRLPWLLLALAPLADAGIVDGGHAPRVAVDIGHTLVAPGAVSARGRTEFEFNRELAHAVVASLSRLGVAGTLVNADGAIASLAARPAQAPQAGLFISIHHDSVNEWELQPWQWAGRSETYSDRWAGHSMFVSRRNPDVQRSLLCASAIGARLQRAGFAPTDKNARRRPYADALHAVHFYDDLVVLYRATQPALLFEAGVIKHRDEELLLRDPRRQALMAGEIATGIAACLSVPR
jgi:N-acetylmuramoyl-L-alanine amidase